MTRWIHDEGIKGWGGKEHGWWLQYSYRWELLSCTYVQVWVIVIGRKLWVEQRTRSRQQQQQLFCNVCEGKKSWWWWRNAHGSNSKRITRDTGSGWGQKGACLIKISHIFQTCVPLYIFVVNGVMFNARDYPLDLPCPSFFPVLLLPVVKYTTEKERERERGQASKRKRIGCMSSCCGQEPCVSARRRHRRTHSSTM